MKTTLRILTLIGAALYASPLIAQVQVPTLMNYQGQLAKSDGTPLPTADHTLTFSIYDAAQGGSLIWGPQIFDGGVGQGHGPKIPVVQGYFNAMLGAADTSNRPLSGAFSAASRFVEIKVGGDPPVSPRQQFLTAPFAFTAANAVEAEIAKVALDAQKVQGQTLLDASTGALKTDIIAVGSIPASAIAANDSITRTQLAPNSVTGNELTDTSVTIGKLGGRRGPRSTSAVQGDIAVSNVSGPGGVHTITGTTGETIGSAITLATSGRPVRIQLAPAGSAAAWVDYLSSGTAGEQGVIKLFRSGGANSASYQIRMVPRGSNTVSAMPGSISFIDFPPAGNYSYTLQGSLSATGGAIRVIGCHLIAYEL